MWPGHKSFYTRAIQTFTLYCEIFHLTVVTDDGEALSTAFSSNGDENHLTSRTQWAKQFVNNLEIHLHMYCTCTYLVFTSMTTVWPGSKANRQGLTANGGCSTKLAFTADWIRTQMQYITCWTTSTVFNTGLFEQISPLCYPKLLLLCKNYVLNQAGAILQSYHVPRLKQKMKWDTFAFQFKIEHLDWCLTLNQKMYSYTQKKKSWLIRHIWWDCRFYGCLVVSSL